MGLKLNTSPMKYYKTKNSPIKTQETIEAAKVAPVMPATVINAKAAKGGEEAGEHEKTKN